MAIFPFTGELLSSPVPMGWSTKLVTQGSVVPYHFPVGFSCIPQVIGTSLFSWGNYLDVHQQIIARGFSAVLRSLSWDLYGSHSLT